MREKPGPGERKEGKWDSAVDFGWRDGAAAAAVNRSVLARARDFPVFFSSKSFAREETARDDTAASIFVRENAREAMTCGKAYGLCSHAIITSATRHVYEANSNFTFRDFLFTLDSH